MSFDWSQMGTLRHVSGEYVIRTDALWILILTAMQGYEGSLEDMSIRMKDGIVYGPAEILGLAKKPGRRTD